MSGEGHVRWNRNKQIRDFPGRFSQPVSGPDPNAPVIPTTRVSLGGVAQAEVTSSVRERADRSASVAADNPQGNMALIDYYYNIHVAKERAEEARKQAAQREKERLARIEAERLRVEEARRIEDARRQEMLAAEDARRQEILAKQKAFREQLFAGRV